MTLTRRRLLAASSAAATAATAYAAYASCEEKEKGPDRYGLTHPYRPEPAAEGTPRPTESASPRSSSSRRPRVLVTGFHDWRELESNLWRCRDNPSCRVLYGAPSASPPIEKAGPLVRALRAAGHEADFCFQSLPTIWGTAGACDLLSFDLVVHMGLGVYDNTDTILLERGAWNERRGNDALGQAAPGNTLDSGAPQVLSDGATAANVTALAGVARLAGGHAVRIAEARPANAYICNETHWRALKAVQRAGDRGGGGGGGGGGGAGAGGDGSGDGVGGAISPSGDGDEVRLRAAYFVHLPYAAPGDEGYAQLGAS